MASILFDMDGLLLDTERVALLAYREACAYVGIPATDDLFMQMVGKSGDVSRALVAETYGDSVDLEQFGKVWNSTFNAIVEEDVPLKPGVGEVIPALYASGARMVVVTSTYTDPARRELNTAGLLKYFETVVGGSDVKNRKPHPEPYLTGAAKLGIPASECFAFEDSDTGVRAALAAGCMVSQIPDLRPPDAPIPELGQKVFPDLISALTARGLL